MLKTNELRIGNRIIYAGIEIIVKGIVNNTIHHSKGQFDQNHEPSYEPFRGIKISSEYLLEFGFIEVSKYCYKNDYCLIELDLDSNWTFRIRQNELESIYIRDLDFVHELQNAYFSCRGEELVFSTEP